MASTRFLVSVEQTLRDYRVSLTNSTYEGRRITQEHLEENFKTLDEAFTFIKENVKT